MNYIIKEGDKATHPEINSNLATEVEAVTKDKVKFLGDDKWFNMSDVVLVQEAGLGFLNAGE